MKKEEDSMKKVAIVSLLLLAACGGIAEDTIGETSPPPNVGGQAGSSAGGSAGSMSGSYGSAGSGDSSTESYLTRGEFAIMLVNNTLDYGYFENVPCQSKWQDVPNDTTLCFAVTALAEAGVEIVYTTDSGDKVVQPENTIPWQEARQLTVQATGWVPYPDKCLAEEGIPPQGWNAWYAGALCSRGLLWKNGNDVLVKPEAGKQFLQNVRDFQGKSATRFDTIEVLANRFLGFKYDEKASCTTTYSDVEPETMRCQLTAFMVDKGLAKPFPDGEFHGENTVNSAEYMKLLAYSAQIDTPQCQSDACAGTAAKNQWYCAYAQAVCATGVVDSIVPADFIFRDFLTITTIEMKKYLTKLRPQGQAPRSI